MQIEENGNGVESEVGEEQHNDKHQVSKSVKEFVKATPGRVERRSSQTSVNSTLSSSNVLMENQPPSVEHEKTTDHGKTLALA